MALGEDDSDYWKNKGDEYVKNNQYDSAIQCYEYALHLDQQNRAAWNNLGYAFVKMGRIEEAKKVKDRISEIDKKVRSDRLDLERNQQIVERKRALKRHGKYIFSIIVVLGVLFVIITLIQSFSSVKPSSQTTTSLSTEPTLIQPVTSVTPSPTPSIIPITLTQASRDIKILQDILTNYHNTHTYFGPDIYVCGDMASDVWNMVETQGIHAILRVGNVEKKVSSLKDANHVWVLAETPPGKWIAMETTGGYLVCDDREICPVMNQLYYSGWDFNNPRELDEALEKQKHPCPEGYIFGSDQLCHQACGGDHYCTGNSVCVNGRCLSCEEGYYLGQDLMCHPLGQPTPTSQPLTGTNWKLKTYLGNTGSMTNVIPTTKLTVYFDNNGKLSGTAGCNSFEGSYIQVSYSQGSNRISIGSLTTPEKNCENSSLMDQELVYLTLLRRVRSYETTINGILNFRDDAGTLVLVYSN